MNGDVFFVSARTKEHAIVMLDEWDNAGGAEISHKVSGLAVVDSQGPGRQSNGAYSAHNSERWR
jgi:hypothetical protein